ncbi:nucleotidyltransferase family protein [Chitinophaga deserti]|uniref:nucleotidyltransferase family protein n=1 Tax=Chitinophaga deserti TaxID=2164099 RepID=UPI000D6B79EF|nr:nucleotidyltransferase family protein [Chitinophaga deserti]
MKKFTNHLILEHELVRGALEKLNVLGIDAILFVTDKSGKLLGSLTDGDVRRGFLKGLSFETPIIDFVQKSPVFIRQDKYTVGEIESYKKRNLKIIPILNEEDVIVDILNLRIKSNILPVEAVIMAGGKGQRLLPLTEKCPKPLLKVGDRPIIEHNVDRLANFGISKIVISINYLGEQIKEYFGDGTEKDIIIQYIEETEPLGTFGALGLYDDFQQEHILLMNSDILTNIDFADFYKSFLESGAQLLVASVPYTVKVPYAVLEIEQGAVTSFVEKPTYNYYSNGGIYLFHKSLLNGLAKGQPFNATDFMDKLISENLKVAHYPILGYWLDIGKHEDYRKAQEDILHITL